MRQTSEKCAVRGVPEGAAAENNPYSCVRSRRGRVTPRAVRHRFSRSVLPSLRTHQAGCRVRGSNGAFWPLRTTRVARLALASSAAPPRARDGVSRMKNVHLDRAGTLADYCNMYATPGRRQASAPHGPSSCACTSHQACLQQAVRKTTYHTPVPLASCGCGTCPCHARQLLRRLRRPPSTSGKTCSPLCLLARIHP